MLGHRQIGERVLELLAGIDLSRPRVDEGELAFRLFAYVRALGLSSADVRFTPDVRALQFARVHTGRDRGAWPAFAGRQWRVLDKQVVRYWERGPGGMRLEQPAAAIEQLIDVDRTVLRAGLGWNRYVYGVRSVTGVLELIARTLAEGRTADPPKRVDALVPLAQAAAAGLFAYAVAGDGDLVALVRPRMRFDAEGLLHDWDGLPAAEWPNGKGLYFWHGVEMTESAGRDPDAVTPSRVLGWANAERRRVALERIGLERFMRAVGAEVIQEDDYGRLWRSPREVDGEPFFAVEVVNATPEPDGSFKRYFLRVPPSTRTARSAVAWSFGLTTKSYAPAVES